MNKIFINRALLAASLIVGFSAIASVPAKADDDHDRGRHEGYERDHDRGEWREHREHEWREHHYYAPPPVVYAPAPRAVYVPPPVYAAPVYPTPGINLVIPLHIR